MGRLPSTADSHTCPTGAISGNVPNLRFPHAGRTKSADFSLKVWWARMDAHPLSAAIKSMSSRRRADGFREPQCVAIWVIDVELTGSPRLIGRPEMDWTLTLRWL